MDSGNESGLFQPRVPIIGVSRILTVLFGLFAYLEKWVRNSLEMPGLSRRLGYRSSDIGFGSSPGENIL